MTGDIYFGYHRDITFGSIAHYLAHIFVGIISAIRQWLVFSRIKSEDFPFAYGTFLCQFRPTFHFNTPGLIVRQMPMEVVKFMKGKVINILFDEIYGEEMAYHIQMHTTIRETRIVVNFHSRKDR